MERDPSQLKTNRERSSGTPAVLSRAESVRASLVAFGLTLLLGLAVAGCHARADEIRACGELCGFRGAESFSVEHPSDDPRCVCRPLADGGTK